MNQSELSAVCHYQYLALTLTPDVETVTETPVLETATETSDVTSLEQLLSSLSLDHLLLCQLSLSSVTEGSFRDRPGSFDNSDKDSCSLQLYYSPGDCSDNSVSNSSARKLLLLP